MTTSLAMKKMQERSEEGGVSQSGEIFRSFVDRMTEGAVSVNPDCTITYCNNSFAAMVGLVPATALGKNFEKFVWEEDRRYCKHLMQQGAFAEVKGEVSLLGKSGYMPVQIAVAPGGIDTLSVLVTDLTVQKETQTTLRQKIQQLQASHAALELSKHDLQQFASVASHDLQEPLRKIQIFSNAIIEKHDNELSPSSRQFVNKILASAERMNVLLFDILNYSKLSATGNKFESTDLNKLLAELLEDMELTISESHARIVVDHLPRLEINPGQMRQCFQNLLSNAIKFAKKGEPPMINISTVHGVDKLAQREDYFGKFCHIRVRDNGIGFEEKYAKSIFNLFEKLHPKDQYEGTGIGLAIAKKIVEKHNGHITVKSKPGVGSEFIVSLPVYQPSQSEAKPS
jgi:PAS domain S-box-containing protein